MALTLPDHPLFEDRGEGHKTNFANLKGVEQALSKAAPQAALVLEYLASGRGLSVLIAHTVLGVTSLTTRIAELRKAGIPISGKWHKDHADKRFMVYHFDREAENGGEDEALFQPEAAPATE